MGKVLGKVESKEDIAAVLNFSNNEEAVYRKVLPPEEKSERIMIKISGPSSNAISCSSSCSSSASSTGSSPPKRIKRISPIVPGASNENNVMVARLRRIIKELTALQASVHLRIGLQLRDNDLATWEVEMYHVDSDSELCQQMYLMGMDHLLLELCFTSEFPYSPPTLKVLCPELHDPSHELIKRGGGVDMQRLAPGWTSYTSVESLFMQFEVLLAKLRVELKRSPS
ncbi:ubiquitin-conjugating enzyme E2Q-like protein 1 [Cloeon dipterum]|uniref:ubiquitin-conjugating enzyme E2Q-like protein 1 n=1 Tax=Cloeon dipterum TaxID=197152 RepID=UPI003220845D